MKTYKLCDECKSWIVEKKNPVEMTFEMEKFYSEVGAYFEIPPHATTWESDKCDCCGKNRRLIEVDEFVS